MNRISTGRFVLSVNAVRCAHSGPIYRNGQRAYIAITRGPISQWPVGLYRNGHRAYIVMARGPISQWPEALYRNDNVFGVEVMRENTHWNVFKLYYKLIFYLNSLANKGKISSLIKFL